MCVCVQAVYLFKVNKFDLLCWVASFCGVLFYSVEIGLLMAVGLAIALVVYNSAFPPIVVLGQIKNSRFHRNVKQFPGARITPGLLEFRVDAPLYYANITVVQVRTKRQSVHTHTHTHTHAHTGTQAHTTLYYANITVVQVRLIATLSHYSQTCTHTCVGLKDPSMAVVVKHPQMGLRAVHAST